MKTKELRSKGVSSKGVKTNVSNLESEMARLSAVVEELSKRVEALEGAQRFRLEKPTKCELPDRAWELLEKARDGGLLDAELRPKCSRTMLALLANYISCEVWGKRRWKPFEALWNIKQLQCDYQRALSLYKFERLDEIIIATLSPLV